MFVVFMFVYYEYCSFYVQCGVCFLLFEGKKYKK